MLIVCSLLRPGERSACLLLASRLLRPRQGRPLLLHPAEQVQVIRDQTRVLRDPP